MNRQQFCFYEEILNRIGISTLRYSLFLVISDEASKAAELTCKCIQKMEESIFSKNNKLIAHEKVQDLVIGYLLVVKEIDMLQTQKKSLPSVLPQGKPVKQLRMEFLANAQKLVTKYLGDRKEFQQTVQNLCRKGCDDEYMNFVGKYLQSEYMLQPEFQSIFYLMNHIERNSEVVVRPKSRLIISGRKKSQDETVEGQRKFINNKSNSINLIKLDNITPSESFVTPSKKLINVVNPTPVAPLQPDLNLLKELNQCKAELASLRAQYQQDKRLIEEKAEVKRMQQQMQQMEHLIQSLKGQHLSHTRELQTKEEEVEELKSQLNEINEKQKKLEKLVQIQSTQQQQWIQTQTQAQALAAQDMVKSVKQTSSWTSLPLKDEDRTINRKNNGRNNNNAIRMSSEEDSVSAARKNSRTIELYSFEKNISFTKQYRTFQFKDQRGTLWDNEFNEVQNFKVTASLLENQEGRFISLSASIGDQIVANEQFDQNVLQYMFAYLELTDVCPSNMVTPNSNSTHHFFKHLLMPFVVVTQNEDQSYKIQVWPKAPGLLSGLMLKTDFLDINCLVFVHYLEFDHFRVVLCDPFGLETVRFDIEMDYSTLDYFFSGFRFVKDEFASSRLEALRQMTNKIEAKKMDGDLHEGMQLMEFDKNKVRTVVQQSSPTYDLENLQLTKPKEFLKFLRQSINEMESLLKKTSCTSFQGSKYLKYKTWNNASKGQAQLVKEEGRNLNVSLSNSHETFGPEKSKLRISGNRSLTYEQVKRDFAVDYDQLNSEEKTIVCHLILHQFSLNVFDKAIEQTVEQFDYNPIIQNQLEVGAYQRFMVSSEQGTVPMTFGIVGIGRRMLGVKLSVFDMFECIEHGMFLTTTPSDWDLRGSEKIQKTKASIQNIPFSEHFVTQVCWDKMFKELMLSRVTKGIPFKERKMFIDKLEYYLNPNELQSL